MWEKIRVVFTIPELRQKILLTLLLLAIYRIGWQVPLPMIDQEQMKHYFSSQNASGLAQMLSQVAVFSASQLSLATIFGLGIMPYISASIIFQLVGQRVGSAGAVAEGRGKRPQEDQRIHSLCDRGHLPGAKLVLRQFFGQSGAGSPSMISADFLTNGQLGFFWHFVAVLIMTCGTIFLMWVGEQIDEFGIGNGISLLIMAGILAGMPGAAIDMLKQQLAGTRRRGGQVRPGKMAGLGDLVRVRRGGGRVHDARSAAHSDAKREARPRTKSVWRRKAISSFANQSIGRDADHFRQQLAVVPQHVVWSLGIHLRRILDQLERSLHPRQLLSLQPAVYRPDLLLLLFLDGHHV